jgi:hypothetical protein
VYNFTCELLGFFSLHAVMMWLVGVCRLTGGNGGVHMVPVGVGDITSFLGPTQPFQFIKYLLLGRRGGVKIPYL